VSDDKSTTVVIYNMGVKAGLQPIIDELETTADVFLVQDPSHLRDHAFDATLVIAQVITDTDVVVINDLLESYPETVIVAYEYNEDGFWI
jgi:hypothetical protein